MHMFCRIIIIIIITEELENFVKTQQRSEPGKYILRNTEIYTEENTVYTYI